MITREQVLHVARLARLTLTEDEILSFTDQLEKVLGHIEELNTADTTGVEPTCFASPVHDPLRDDIPADSLPRKDLLSNGPLVKKEHFAVPKVIAQ
jgi:aspartyl-tRNA(Asn)/glutamyl-tRNA(Gln) amidotransferase subunit C